MRGILPALLLLWGFAASMPAAAHPPYGLIADAEGNVYFSDLETVWRLSSDGRLTVFRPAVPETHVHELALAPDGAIQGDQNRYDPATQRFYTGLWRRSRAGAERMIVEMTERPPPGTGVWEDSAGNRYASQWISNEDRRTRLLRRRPDGRVEILFDESAGSARPLQPSVASVGGMALGPDGSLYFADRGLLRRLLPDGAVTIVYDGRSGSSLRGLAASPEERVLAADMGAKTVLAMGSNGTATTLYRETGPWLPTAVVVTGGRLLVLEANADPREQRDRVRVIEVRDGRATVVASPGAPGAPEAPEGAAPPPLPPETSGPGMFTILLAAAAASATLFAAWRLFSRRKPRIRP